MPWCPRCDETFPEGPVCPRCSARLVQREDEVTGEIETLRSVPAVRSLRVSRRHRRALERMSGPRAQPMRMLALSIVALVFVSGFLLGRFAGIGPAGPTVHALAPTRALQIEGVDGSAAYALWSSDSLATIAQHDLYSGDVEPLARFSPPPLSGRLRTQVVSFGRSVSLIVADSSDHSYVLIAAAGAPVHGWVPGVEAAWGSERVIYVRGADRSITKYTVTPERVTSGQLEKASRVFQTASGAVVQTAGVLRSAGGSKQLASPDVRVFAVAPSVDRAIVDHGGPAIWDGRRFIPVHVDGFEVVAASFERSGERAAVTLRRDDELTVAIVDQQGNAAVKPLGVADRGCPAAGAWDAGGRFVYIAPGDGKMHAVEAGGGAVEPVQTGGAGCGIAWLAI